MKPSPDISVVVAAADARHRLRQSLDSIFAAGRSADLVLDVVVALGQADAVTREVARAYRDGPVRLVHGMADTPRSAARAARAALVATLRGGDLLGPRYFGAMGAVLRAGGPIVARPAAFIRYGGAPAIRLQHDVEDDESRAAAVFASPFAPPLMAGRALLLSLREDQRAAGDSWAWTLASLAAGVSHRAAAGAVYLAWTPPAGGGESLTPRIGGRALRRPWPRVLGRKF